MTQSANQQPFWLLSNNNGANPSNYLNISFYDERFLNKLTRIEYGIKTNLYKNFQNIQFEKLYFKIKNDKIFLRLGSNENLQNRNKKELSTGSLIESTNAKPIPKIIIGNSSYAKISLFKSIFYIKGVLAHGYLDRNNYKKAPLLHQKSISIKKHISANSSFTAGINHMAQWGGSSAIHGDQPSGYSEFLRVFFARPGSRNSIKQEQENSLGNHLGVWDFSFERKIKDKLLTFYYEHPFEDESGARWLLNELDGKYGLNITSFNSSLISDFTYEFIYTMDQSGSQGASDSTYGWDNYFNHYIYQSGWTYKNRMIGNPLFTVGKNPGRYSDGNYIINNRIKAHHIGLAGKIRDNVNFRILFTYSKNYGIYPDKNYYIANGVDYKFDDGLDQLSTLYEIKLNNLWENISITAAYAKDQGELLPKTDSFMMIINYKL